MSAKPSAPPPAEGLATASVVLSVKDCEVLSETLLHSAPTCVACPAKMDCVMMPHAAAEPSAVQPAKAPRVQPAAGAGWDSVALATACVHALPPVAAVTPHQAHSLPLDAPVCEAEGLRLADSDVTVLAE